MNNERTLGFDEDYVAVNNIKSLQLQRGRKFK